jgi:hypothetical protein
MDWVGRLLDQLMELWERGKSLLGALALICAAILLVFAGGSVFEVPGALDGLRSYGLGLFIGAIVFGILAGVKAFEGRKPPSVSLLGIDRECFWVQSKQQSGQVITQFSIHFQATNLTNGPVRLSPPKIVRPWTRARIIDNVLLIRHPNPRENGYGHAFPILAGATTEAACTIILDRPVGRPRKPKTVVLKISDQFKHRHKLKFRLRWAGA